MCVLIHYKRHDSCVSLYITRDMTHVCSWNTLPESTDCASVMPVPSASAHAAAWAEEAEEECVVEDELDDEKALLTLHAAPGSASACGGEWVLTKGLQASLIWGSRAHCTRNESCSAPRTASSESYSNPNTITEARQNVSFFF